MKDYGSSPLRCKLWSPPSFPGLQWVGAIWQPWLHWMEALKKRTRETHFPPTNAATTMATEDGDDLFYWNCEASSSKAGDTQTNRLNILIISIGDIAIFSSRHFSLYSPGKMYRKCIITVPLKTYWVYQRSEASWIELYWRMKSYEVTMCSTVCAQIRINSHYRIAVASPSSCDNSPQSRLLLAPLTCAGNLEKHWGFEM